MNLLNLSIRLIAVLAVGSIVAACNTPPPATPPLEDQTDIVIATGLPVVSDILGETRRINVYLPFGYEQQNRSWPVVYLIDGGAQQDFFPVAGFGALATLSGQYEEFIVVGVQTNDRRYELTPPSEVAYDLEQIPRNGGADDFRRCVTGGGDHSHRDTGDDPAAHRFQPPEPMPSRSSPATRSPLMPW